jgi:hypothetical protein
MYVLHVLVRVGMVDVHMARMSLVRSLFGAGFSFVLFCIASRRSSPAFEIDHYKFYYYIASY